MAEAFLQQRLKQEGLDDWQVQSAGTWTMDGAVASRHGMRVLAEQGVDISSHRSQQLDGHLMEWADLVLVMTQNHAEILRLEYHAHSRKVFLLSEMKDGRRYDVDDPYGGPLEEYLVCANLIGTLVDEGWDRIKNLAKQNAQSGSGARSGADVS